LHSAFDPRVELTEFDLARYEQFLDSIRPGAAAFKQRQTQAFREERERWRVNGLLETATPLIAMPEEEVSDRAVPEGCEAVHAPMAASVFRVAAEPGQRVIAGQRLVVLDAMKIELEIAAPVAGVVRELLCRPGQMVNAGQQLAILCTS
jgi:urea carboxylase